MPPLVEKMQGGRCDTRVGILSDTHGSVAAWQAAFRGPLRDADLLLHAGDFLYHGPRNPLPQGYDPKALAGLINSSSAPILAARGNCDADIDQVLIDWPLQAPYALAQVDGIRLMLSHGHEKSEEERLALAKRYRVHIWITGHTHVPALCEQQGVVLLNPGSPALPKGDPAVPTVAWLDTEARRARVVSLDGEPLLELTF